MEDGAKFVDKHSTLPRALLLAGLAAAAVFLYALSTRGTGCSGSRRSQATSVRWRALPTIERS